MVSNKRIQEAAELVEWLRKAIHEQPLPASDRVRASASCFAIALDHHHAIVTLVENRLYASCFALIRLEFEAYIRGQWIYQCATDSQVKRFVSGKKCDFLETNTIINEIEIKLDNSEKTLTKIKQQAWNSMCAYTHTGGLHVQRWNTNDAIEPNYSEAEVEEVLKFSEIFGVLSVISITGLGNLEKIGNQVLSRFEKLLQN